jgi:hypothetical protein
LHELAFFSIRRLRRFPQIFEIFLKIVFSLVLIDEIKRKNQKIISLICVNLRNLRIKKRQFINHLPFSFSLLLLQPLAFSLQTSVFKKSLSSVDNPSFSQALPQ